MTPTRNADGTWYFVNYSGQLRSQNFSDRFVAMTALACGRIIWTLR